MNWLQRIGAKALGFNVIGQKNNNLQWQINTAGEWIYQNGSQAYIDQGYKALPNVYSLISLILNKSTIVPYGIYKKKDKRKYIKYKAALKNAKNPQDYAKTIMLKNQSLELVEGTEVEKLIENPNSYQSTEQLNWELDGYKLLTGNAILYKLALSEGGKPKELHNIPSPLVDMVVKGTPFEPEFEYKVSYLQNTIKGDDICHFKYWNPISSYTTPGQQYWGLSPLKSCERLLGRYKDADITQGFQFKNMGPAGMITGASSNLEANLTEEQALSVQERFDQQHTGTYNAGKILVTPSNLKWTMFGLSPVDLNILESKADMAVELANAYHTPPEMIGGEKKYSNFEQARKAFITDAVIPLVESRKQVLQKEVVDKFNDDLVIEYDYTIFHELQDDLKKLAETYKIMDWYTDNEKRLATGGDRYDDPAADKLYKNPSLVPIEVIGMTGEPPMVDEDLLNN